MRIEEVEEGGQTTGEGQSGHVELTQIGGQVTDLEHEKNKKNNITLLH